MYPAGSEHTQREIRQQPELWREVAAQIAGRRAEIDAFCAPVLENPHARIVLTGAGTSAFIGDIAAPALSKALGRRVDAVATTDIVSDPHGFLAGDEPLLLVSFARSGNSPESIAATEIADRLLGDVRHLIVTCNATGALAVRAEDAARVLAITLPERSNDAGFAMTSSFSSMLLAGLLALTGDTDIEPLALATEHMVATLPATVEALTRSGFERVIYLGSGPLLGLAHESALKLLELAAGQTDAYFDSALGLRHGPKALVRAHTLVVQYFSNDAYTRKYDLDLAQELLGDGIGRLFVIAATPPAGFDTLDWGGVDLSGIADGFLALPFAVFAQMLAVEQSLHLGYTPDNPFPGGTVNRVVKGVRIHDLD